MKISSNIGDVLLSIVCFYQSVLVILQLILGMTGLTSVEDAATLRIVASAIPVAIASIVIFKRGLTMAVGIYFVYLILCLYSITISPKNQEYIMSEGLRFTAAIVIPTFICTALIRNVHVFLRTLTIISIACIVAGAIFTFFWKTKGMYNTEHTYLMSFGYAMLMPAVVFFRKRNVYGYILGILSILIILMVGSRGPAFTALSFLGFLFLIYLKEKKLRKQLLWIIFGIIVAIVLIPYFSETSRTVALYQRGELIVSGRENIYTIIWRAIEKSPIIGYGIFGDRPFIGGYSHNIVLEIFSHFGMVVGTLIVLWISAITIRKIISANIEYRILIVMFFIVAIMPLWVSNSYLQRSEFALFLGFLYNRNLKEDVEKSQVLNKS